VQFRSKLTSVCRRVATQFDRERLLAAICEDYKMSIVGLVYKFAGSVGSSPCCHPGVVLRSVDAQWQ